MRLRLLRGSEREPREPLGGKGTSKINIYRSKVPLVPSVPSNSPRACKSELFVYICKKCSSEPPTMCKKEGTEGTKGTRALKIAIFWFPLLKTEGTQRELLGDKRGTFGQQKRALLVGRPIYE